MPKRTRSHVRSETHRLAYRCDRSRFYSRPPRAPSRPTATSPIADADDHPTGWAAELPRWPDLVSTRGRRPVDGGGANRPATTGDRIWADSTGRAELDAGSAVLRMATFTELDLVRLDDHWLQVRLPQGDPDRAAEGAGGDQDNEIDAPNAAVALLESGKYRIDVSGDGRTTTVTVWSGRAQVTAAGSSFYVESGQLATIRGDSTLSYDLANVGAPNDFDRWSQSRDAREDAATTARPTYRGHARRRRPRRLRSLGHGRLVRAGLVPHRSRCGMGALSGGPLGVGHAWG